MMNNSRWYLSIGGLLFAIILGTFAGVYEGFDVGFLMSAGIVTYLSVSLYKTWHQNRKLKLPPAQSTEHRNLPPEQWINKPNEKPTTKRKRRLGR